METKQCVFRLNILYPHVTLSRAHMPCTRLLRTWQYRRLCLRAPKTSTWERGREMHPAWINFFQAYEIQRYLGMRSKAATVDIEKVHFLQLSHGLWPSVGPALSMLTHRTNSSVAAPRVWHVVWNGHSRVFPKDPSQWVETLSWLIIHCLSTFHPFCCLHSNHRTEWRIQTWPKVEPLKMYLHNS